jgi:transcriptional regulator with XRE-family HTH domain
VVIDIHCSSGALVTPSIGPILRRARAVRQLSAADAARAADISPAYLSKLENDAVKRPSPHVLNQLGRALGVPYAELMRLCGYPVPGEPEASPAVAVGASLFADLNDDEREELLEYLAWYRARRRAGRGGSSARTTG